jgi:hypothetical protein
MSRIGQVLAVTAAVLLALVLLALLLTPVFIERTIRAELAKRGVNTVAMDMSVPGLTGSTVRSVRIGRDGAFTADEIAVRYHITDLIHGRIDGIRLLRPRLHLSVTSDGKISLGSLDPLVKGETENVGGGFVLPAPVEIIGGSLTVATPSGEFTSRLDGAVSLEPGTGPLNLDISGPWLSAKLTVSLSLSGSVPSLSGRLLQAQVTHPLISIGSLSGDFSSSFGPQTPVVSANLKLAEINSPFLSFGGGAASGNLSARYKEDMVTGTLRLAGSAGSLEAGIAAEPSHLLHVSLRGDHLAIPEKLVQASLDAALDFDPGARRAVLTKPARIEARVAPELRASFPEIVRSLLADTPLTMTAEPGLTASQTTAGSTVAGRVALKQQSTLTASLDGALEQNEGGLSGSVNLRVDMPKLVLAAAVFERPSLIAPLQVATEGGRTQIGLRGPAPLSAAALRLGTTRITKLVIPFQPSEQPLFTLGSEGASFALSAGASKASGQLGQDQQPVAIEWKGATLASSPGSTLNAAVTGGRVALPRSGWQANGIDAELKTSEGGSVLPEIRLAIAELVQTGTHPVLAPLAIKGTVRPFETPLRFDLAGQGTGGRVQLSVKGSHDLAQNRGTATFALDPLRFDQGGLQPGAVAPVLGDALTEATGTLTMGGTVSWSSDGISSDLQLSAESLAFVSPLGPVLGLDGRVQVTGLAPLATPPGQQIKVAAVQAALPMSDIQFQFGLREGRYLDLEDGSLALAGGQIAIAPATLDADAERNSLKLKVTNIGLPELFKLIGLDGLTGTGRLSGEVPIALAHADVAIENGKLESQEPGQIQYNPATPPSSLQGGGKSVELALAALRNFQYDRLTLGLDRKFGGETLVALHIAGKNPDFYGGYPVEFNLNLTGKLDQILIQSLAGYRIPKTLEDTLKQSPSGSANPP